MTRFLIAFCVLAVLPTFPVAGQVRLNGRITDQETGDPLPGATVQVEGTFQGSVSNNEGQFYLIVRRVPAVLIVRHIGYRTGRVQIQEARDQEINVSLEPAPVALGELTVSGEDPAVGIMRKVLAKKQTWLAGLRSMYAEVYTRFWLFREFEPVQMSESIRSLYWKPGRGNRELVRARKVRPPGSGVFRFAGPDHVPNLYDDDVSLNGSVYATPTHPDAISIYRFILAGKRKMDDAIVWDINFTPRDPTRTAFTGHLAVLDSVYAMLEIEARPHPATAFQPPVEYHDVRYEQHFVGLRTGMYAPLDFRARGTVGFGRLGVNYPPAQYEQVSSVSNYALDAPVPDSMFSDDRRQRIHPLVDHQDFLFIRNPTIIPLTPRETDLLAAINPRMTIDRAFRGDGLLRQYTGFRVTEKADEEESSKSIIGSLMNHAWLWYDRVDGWHPGLVWDRSFRSDRRITARVGYSVERRDPTARFRVETAIVLFPISVRLFAIAGDETRPVGQASVYGLFVPGLMTYAGYDDYFDFYRRREAVLGTSLENPTGTIGLTVSAHLEKHGSLSKNTNFNGWFLRNEQRENPSIPEGNLASVQALLHVEASDGDAGVRIRFERAETAWFGSEFDFTSVQGSVYWRTRTFFKTRERPNVLRLLVKAGSANRGLPVQRYGILDGSTGPWAAFGTFRTLDDRHVSGYRYAALFWEHDFTTALFERLGLWRLADGGSGLILFGGHGRIFDLNAGTGWMHEAGLGWAFPFRLPIRVDLAARLDTPGLYFRIGKAQL